MDWEVTPEPRQRTNQSLEIRRGGGGSWIRREVYSASRLRSRQSQVPTPYNKENIPLPGARVRSRRSPLPHWYPRTPLRDITVVVHALERRRKRLRAAAAAAQRRNPTNPEEPSSIRSSRSRVTPEMNASVHDTPGCQEVTLSPSHDASPSPVTASPSSSISASPSSISASTAQHNLCPVSHPPKEKDDHKTARHERKLEKLLVVHRLNKPPSNSRGCTRQLMSMR